MARRETNASAQVTSEGRQPDRGHGALALSGASGRRQPKPSDLARREERRKDPELLRDLRAALGDVDGRRSGPQPCGEVRIPGESFNRRLYRMPDGLYVAGPACTAGAA